MSIIRFCPHCLKEIPINQGFSFDDELNLICENCGKVIFPTTTEKEREVFNLFPLTFEKDKKALFKN